jgi:diacylglycerol kinase (ATP)
LRPEKRRRVVSKPQQPLSKAFACAYRGIVTCVRTSRNFRIHLVVAALVLLAGALLRLERWEWCAVVLCIVVVLGAEAFNSAVEKTVDLACDEYDERARQAKDIAAGAVLLLAKGVAVVGLIVFIGAALRLFS